MTNLNREPGRSAAEVNLDGAPMGFRVTGDAAWDTGSTDYAMFSAQGNLAVAGMVLTASALTLTEPEAVVLAWIETEKARIADGSPEVYDTMVRETIAYALDTAWARAYGHTFED